MPRKDRRTYQSRTEKPEYTKPHRSAAPDLSTLSAQPHPASLLRRAQDDPSSLDASDVLRLQASVGNQAVMRILARTNGAPSVSARSALLPPSTRSGLYFKRDNGSPSTEASRETIAAEPGAKAEPGTVRRKYLIELTAVPWTGRTGKPEKQQLYEEIQQLVNAYEETPASAKLADMQADLLFLVELHKKVVAWQSAYGSSKTHAAAMDALLREVGVEETTLQGRISIASRALGSPSESKVPAEVKATPPPLLVSPSPPPMSVSVASGSPPARVKATPPPLPRRLPPPLPSPTPPVSDEALSPEVASGLPPAPVEDKVTPPPPSSTPPSVSGPSVRERIKLAEKVGADANKAPEIKHSDRAWVPTPPSEVKEGERLGAYGMPMASGEGTNIQNAVEQVYAAWNNGQIRTDEMSDDEQDNISAVLETLNAAREEMAAKPPSVEEQRKILALLRVIEGGDANAIGAQLRANALDVRTDSESKEDKSDDYLVRQRAKLGAVQSAMASHQASQSADDYASGLKRGVIKTKAVGYTKTAAKVGIGVGLMHIPGAGDAFKLATAINQVQSTYRHIRNLRKIRQDATTRRKNPIPETDDFIKDLDYILGKKQAKVGKAVAGGVPGISTLSTVAFKIKGVVKMVKGTRGEHRRAAAEAMIDLAKSGHQDAQLVILELVGESQYEMVLEAENGADLLFRKMASTT